MRLYLLALWRQARGLIMGGSVAAVAVIYTYSTGKSVPTTIAAGIVAFCFLGATYLAWKEQYLRAEALAADGLSLAVTKVAATPGFINLSVDVENSPHGSPVLVRSSCTVDVQFGPGDSLRGLAGSWNNRGGDDLSRTGLRPGQSRPVGIDLPRPPNDPHSTTEWEAAEFTIAATDSLRRRIPQLANRGI